MSASANPSPIKKIVKQEQASVDSKNAALAASKNGKVGREDGGNDNDEPDFSLLSDPEDYLEENESLDMNLTNGNQKVWLVKLPRYLADKWSRTQELGGQQLGTVKIKKSGPGRNKKLQVKLVLKDVDKNSDIPQEYDISVLNTQVHNSYVFSEENLKKFKQELTEMGEMPDQPELKSLDPEPDASLQYRQQQLYKYYSIDRDTPEGDKKYIPSVKTIPKKTNLEGKICHDCQIVPAKSDSKYGSMLLKRQTIMQPAKPRPKVTLLHEIPGVIQSNAGPNIRGNNTSVFSKSNSKKNADGRAIRMPKKDLLDLLFRLFEEYEYWSMKGLKERTRQPESYLKESLESIANLIKKGPYTSKYNLKPEYKRLRDAERAARLGIEVENENNDNADDDDDIEMEDVA